MAREYAMTIEVPEFDERAAYNHHRPISGLIRTQLLHLHAAEQHLPPKHRSNININDLHTEHQASEYIQQVTEKLHARTGPRKPRAASKTKRKKAAQQSNKKPRKAVSEKIRRTKHAKKKRK
jgi:hypothetical protein